MAGEFGGKQSREGLTGWVIGLSLIVLMILAAWWWRQSDPRRPSVPLAEMSLQQFEGWRAGRLPPSKADIERLQDLPAWVKGQRIELELPGDYLEINGPMPSMPMAVDGVLTTKVGKHPTAVVILGDGQNIALLSVFDSTAQVLLGSDRRRLMDEWSHFGFNTGELRVYIWKRRDNIFSVVTTEAQSTTSLTDDPIAWIGELFEDERPLSRPLWLPPPTTGRPNRLGEGFEPGVVLPPQGVADPSAGQLTPAGGKPIIVQPDLPPSTFEE
ncbi:MAG: hypothetical protein ACE366_03925 [Bradymonadia bacterium]